MPTRVSQEIPGNKKYIGQQKYQKFLTFGIKSFSQSQKWNSVRVSIIISDFCPLHFCSVPGLRCRNACGYLKNSTSWNPSRVNARAKWANGACVMLLPSHASLKHIYKCEQMPPMCTITEDLRMVLKRIQKRHTIYNLLAVKVQLLF